VCFITAGPITKLFTGGEEESGSIDRPFIVLTETKLKDMCYAGRGSTVGGFEGSQNDGPKYVVNGERAHVLKSSADIVSQTLPK
jgi:hypothetical protein